MDLISTQLQTQDCAQSLLDAFLSGRNVSTWTAYKTDLNSFSSFLGFESLHLGVEAFIKLAPGEANRRVLLYRSFLHDNCLQSSTINRRLASIRSLVKLARTLGVVTWSIEISNLKVEAYRDTRGPAMNKFCEMLSLAENGGDAKSLRDAAILRLLFDLALRASELTKMDLADFDAERSTLVISAKGRTQKVLLSLPVASCNAILLWIGARGSHEGALFTNFDRARKGARLTRNGLYSLVRDFGTKVGIKTRPHGIRHLSITESCKIAQANGFGLEEVLDHSRHASVATLMVYRDRERNIQGEISSLISAKAERSIW